MKEQHFTASDLALNSVLRDEIEPGLLFFSHYVDGFAFASHIDYESGLYKFDDGMCDFYANGFDCRECSNFQCVKRQNFD